MVRVEGIRDWSKVHPEKLELVSVKFFFHLKKCFEVQATVAVGEEILNDISCLKFYGLPSVKNIQVCMFHNK